MRGWRPDRSHLLLVLASLMTCLGVVQAAGHPPDYGLLGASAPLWLAWSTIDRAQQRSRARKRRKRRNKDGER